MASSANISMRFDFSNFRWAFRFDCIIDSDPPYHHLRMLILNATNFVYKQARTMATSTLRVWRFCEHMWRFVKLIMISSSQILSIGRLKRYKLLGVKLLNGAKEFITVVPSMQTYIQLTWIHMCIILCKYLYKKQIRKRAKRKYFYKYA